MGPGSVHRVAATVALLALAGCGGSEPVLTSGGGDCVSEYDALASADSWPALKRALVANREWGHTHSVRTQVKGHDVGLGTEPAVRVIDLLDAKGRRLVQGEVWRTDDGGWEAGVWLQCID